MFPEKYKTYYRQMIIPGWGIPAQEKVAGSTVLLAGAGGLGSACAMYLAAAGIGKIIICDYDTVEPSNLNRQILHGESSLGRKKVESARERIREMNSRVLVEACDLELTDSSITRVAGEADIIVDCLDNLKTRYVLNRYCARHQVPMVHAGLNGMSGQITVFHPGKGPCMACLFPEHHEKSVNSGPVPVVGAAAGVLSSMQALEVLKLITGMGIPLIGKMLIYNGAEAVVDEVELTIDPACPVCSNM